MLSKIEKTDNQPQRHRDAEESPFDTEGIRFSPRLRVSAVRFIVLILPILLALTGCYAEITGKVVDAETGKPIEGAVVLAEWTITKGLGFTYTESYKVIEAVTDKDGKATISGNFTLNPLVNRPHVTVYKNGYVAWNNEYIFPDYKNRTDFKWENGYVFRLERFKPEYSYDEHESFVDSSIRASLGIEKKHLFLKLYREAEEEKILKERDSKQRRGR